MGKTKTKHPGVYRLADGRYQVMATAGKGGARRAKRTLPTGAGLAEAVAAREALAETLRRPDTTEMLRLSSFAARWLADMGIRPSTRARYQGALLDHILPTLGHLRIDEVNRATVQRWCLFASSKTRANGERYAHQTVLGWWRTCKQLLQDAAADHDLPDPTRRVRPPSTPIAARRRKDALTRAELDAVLEAVRETLPGWYAEIYTLAHTGMRPGELYALEWRDVDTVNGWIYIRRAVWRGEVSGTKTGAERRAPITAGMARVLDGVPRGLPRAIVFPGAGGVHRLPQSLNTTLRRLCRRYGLPNVTPYTFRYTFRTLMRDSGAPDELVRAIQGHADPRMGINYYRVDMDRAAEAVEVIGVPPGL